MSDACEVGADLVHASRFELNFHEVVAFVMLLDAVMRNRFLCFVAVLTDEHLAALGVVRAQKRFVDGAAVFLEVPFDECKVIFIDFVFADKAREVAERIAVECRDNHAGRFLVEAVGDGGLKVKTFSFAPFPKVFDKAFAWARATTGLACESRGLVDDNVIFGLDDKV